VAIQLQVPPQLAPRLFDQNSHLDELVDLPPGQEFIPAAISLPAQEAVHEAVAAIEAWVQETS
jgi:hypothetical protein